MSIFPGWEVRVADAHLSTLGAADGGKDLRWFSSLRFLEHC